MTYFLIFLLLTTIFSVVIILSKQIYNKDVLCNYTFDSIRNNGLLLYEYIRGSYSYGLNVETSDKDTGGIFIADKNMINGLRENYIEQISDEKHDNIWYEIGRFLELLIKSNPTMLESLYVPDDCVLYEHPIITEIKKDRDKFISKDTIKALSGYAIEQIKKAKGYNKLCAYPENMQRKQPIDFCYTFNNYQGTETISNWLEKRGLKQIYCGLNHMPNMNLMHGVFYDWGQHLHMEYQTKDEWYKACHDKTINRNNMFWEKMFKLYDVYGCTDMANLYDIIKPKGYHGIVKDDGTSCDIHLDSILKGDNPICYLSYNKDGYESHCVLYKNWSDWKKVRNKVRYDSNFGTGYDSKNMMHCIRLLTMAVELAQGKGFNMDRRIVGDREFLLNIRNHKYEYEFLIKYAEEKKKELDDAIKTCTLPEHVDKKIANKILLKIREKFK